MEIHEQKAQKRTDGEEDLLNFDLDDLSLEEVDQATAGEEEVIELTDLVEKGSVPAKDSQDEIARLLQEEDAGGGTADIELATKEFAGLNGIQKEKRKEKAESLLDMDDLSLDFSEEEKAPVGEKVAEQEISDSDLAEILKEEGAENLDLGTEEVVVAEDRLQEEVISDADLAAVEDSLPTQELSAMLAPKPSAPKEMVLDLLEEAVVEPEPISPPAAERPIFVPEAPLLEALEAAPLQAVGAGPLGQTTAVEISEERLEAVVRRVVQDVVERVTRETLEAVAERVVRETIEAVAERVVRETLEPVAERVARETLTEATDRVITQAIDALKQSLESPSN